MKKFLVLILAGLFTVSGQAQCRFQHITGKDNSVDVTYDKNDRLVLISGKDEDGIEQGWHFATTNGITFPVTGQKGIGMENNGNGSYMIVMGDGEYQSKFKISKDGTIQHWDFRVDGDDQVNLKTTHYTYDAHGNLTRMVWDGTLDKTKDHGELTATYNLSEPEVLFSAGPFRFLASMSWFTFPFTNTNQLANWTYTQTITMPEREVVKGKDSKGNDIIETIPEKKTTRTYSRSFTYSYNSSRLVTGITVTGGGLPKKFVISYETGNCPGK